MTDLVAITEEMGQHFTNKARLNQMEEDDDKYELIRDGAHAVLIVPIDIEDMMKFPILKGMHSMHLTWPDNSSFDVKNEPINARLIRDDDAGDEQAEDTTHEGMR